jgi:transmembrane sensor
MLDLDSRLRSGPLKVGSVWTPDRSERVARRSLRRRRAIALCAAVSCASAGLAAIYFVVREPRDRQALAGAGAEHGPAGVTPRPVRFADGSTAELHGLTAELHVEEQSASRMLVRLEGGARFEVAKRRARTFEVRSGDVLVRVLGTVFSIDRREARTRVGVERGRVQVSWPGGSAILIAGEVGTFPPKGESAPPSAGERASAPAATEPEPEPEKRASATLNGERVRRGWREWARRREYDRAYAELLAQDGAVADNAADLMLAADVARLSSHPEAAVAPLRELCARYPNDKRAKVAAFTLGRVLLDDLGRAAEAAVAFETACALWPSGPLAEDALSRAVEAHERAGQPERARALAERYLRRFPEGRHAAAIRKSLVRDD